ncbi:SHOCT domain-containing protein [Halorussus gelatinilyticus]|uniref:SHOCT domain-containing protein n=1 Tax=Halorussus gelatinilyticus TaxID=2937524 RepID=A0A8U0IEU0_9EURY|nr:SHOCT domain-containing protein [Halorussus gelatinilyticus]UPV99427.1 SHOCT domain-containing protein [Halorussus gelatinilyticus]
MGLVDDSRVTVLLGGFLLSLLALVGVTALGAFAVLSAFLDPAAGTPLLVALLQTAAPFVAVAAMLGVVSLVLLVGLAVAVVRSASVPRDARLARLARTVERYYPGARSLGLSEKFEPTTEDRIDQLKQRYVEGEITELEYEQRLQELMSDDDVSDDRVRRERERTDRQRDREFEL